VRARNHRGWTEANHAQGTCEGQAERYGRACCWYSRACCCATHRHATKEARLRYHCWQRSTCNSVLPHPRFISAIKGTARTPLLVHHAHTSTPAHAPCSYIYTCSCTHTPPTYCTVANRAIDAKYAVVVKIMTQYLSTGLMQVLHPLHHPYHDNTPSCYPLMISS
jgi:hypothetical protein